KALRDQLVHDGKLVDCDDPSLLVFTENVVFNSPSAAAAVVFGGNQSGPRAWRTEDGSQTYKDWQDAKLRQAGVKNLRGGIPATPRCSEYERIGILRSTRRGRDARQAHRPIHLRQARSSDRQPTPRTGCHRRPLAARLEFGGSPVHQLRLSIGVRLVVLEHQV